MSDGALSFYHDHFVRTRVSKFTYGTICAPLYDPTDPDHQKRVHKTYTAASGLCRVNDSFDIIIPKVCSLSFLIARCSPICLSRTRKSRKPRNSEDPIGMNVYRRMCWKRLHSPCLATEVLWSRRNGKMLIPVSFSSSSDNYEISLTWWYRKLHKPLHNWNGPFIRPTVTSIKVFWARDLLSPWVRGYPVVWSDRVTGYGRLEGECGFPFSFIPDIFIHKMLLGRWTAECCEDYIRSRTHGRRSLKARFSTKRDGTLVEWLTLGLCNLGGLEVGILRLISSLRAGLHVCAVSRCCGWGIWQRIDRSWYTAGL